MNKAHTALTLGALLTLSAGVLAQTDTPGATGAPMTAPMMGAPVTSTDRQFLIQDAQGSVSDYANGAAALNLGQSPAVRQFGIWLLQDHNRLNIGLLMLAQRKGVTLPLTISDADKTKLNALTAKTGADFDRAFLQGAIQTNQQDIRDAKKELAATTDPEVRLLVTDYLTTEVAHLTAAQTIQGSLGKMSGRR
jgi:putative membrane protein